MAADLVAAATSGNRRAALEALRDLLAAATAECEQPRDLPNLARQLSAVLADIDDLPNVIEVSNADEIAARRVTRRNSKPADPARPKRSG